MSPAAELPLAASLRGPSRYEAPPAPPPPPPPPYTSSTSSMACRRKMAVWCSAGISMKRPAAISAHEWSEFCHVTYSCIPGRGQPTSSTWQLTPSHSGCVSSAHIIRANASGAARSSSDSICAMSGALAAESASDMAAP